LRKEEGHRPATSIQAPDAFLHLPGAGGEGREEKERGGVVKKLLLQKKRGDKAS